MISKTYRHLFR